MHGASAIVFLFSLIDVGSEFTADARHFGSRHLHILVWSSRAACVDFLKRQFGLKCHVHLSLVTEKRGTNKVQKPLIKMAVELAQSQLKALFSS
eukprot:37500-Pelagomonas_calceolata.AAC.2